MISDVKNTYQVIETKNTVNIGPVKIPVPNYTVFNQIFPIMSF
jgi:hypothetical protein